MCATMWRHLMKATEVTAGLTESNGSLPPGLWRDSLQVICGLTACTPGSAPSLTLGNEYGKNLPFLSYHAKINIGLVICDIIIALLLRRFAQLVLTRVLLLYIQ